VAGKKNPREWGSIRKQPTKSARYQASFIGPDLARHFAPVTFESKMMAERWLGRERDLIEKCAANDEPWQPPATRKLEKKAESLSLTTYGTEWIEQRKLKPRTRSLYESQFRLHIKPKLGKLAVRDITPVAVRSWHSGLGADNPRRNSQVYGLLHSMLATATDDGLLKSNPCNIKGAMNTHRKREPVILTPAEITALADAIKPERLKTLVLLAAWTGLRWGEISELRRKDIGGECEILNVSRAVTRDKRAYLVDTPKSGKGRTVVIPPHIRADLKHHLDVNVGTNPESLLFPALRGGHMNDRVFSKDALKPALQTIGRDNVTVHMLRHFAGTMTARVANLPETMSRLGHSTHKASLIYQTAVSTRDVEIADALSALAEKPVG
jgi:integrase